MTRTLIASLIVAALIVSLITVYGITVYGITVHGITASGIVAALAHGRQTGRGAPQAPDPARPPLGSTPRPAIPNATPVRSCESLAMI
jgi:hypothetical protein